MLTMSELIRNKDFDSLPLNIKSNLTLLLDRINKLRELWSKPMIVTSGLRTMDEHLAIYAEKGITDILKIPMKSSHLTGQAVDIQDKTFALTKFCKQNDFEILKACELFAEDDMSVFRIHLQINAPRSNSRFFKP